MPGCTVTAEVQQLTRFPVTPGSVSQGDEVVVRSDLFDEAHNKVGESHGTCTTTRGGAHEAEQCLVTYVLPDGQLTTRGIYFNYLDQGPLTDPDVHLTRESRTSPFALHHWRRS
ncbi:hypothetical protein ACFYYB_35010 [Streptomyces sp. NPDC002886]|uniref:hypothetical protein n=1 Tax=Streptomyces sp. NPDC002886 TaxID=3364667 RepID=UPI0036BF8F5F